MKIKAATPGHDSKTALVISLLEKSKGASVAELMKVTGWQAHSVRGLLSGTLRKKMGLKVQSAKHGDGERVYSPCCCGGSATDLESPISASKSCGCNARQL